VAHVGGRDQEYVGNVVIGDKVGTVNKANRYVAHLLLDSFGQG
jgi:hypothetical protein